MRNGKLITLGLVTVLLLTTALSAQAMPQLLIQAPYAVDEYSIFEIQILATNGQNGSGNATPVANATIRPEWTNETFLTDENGVVVLCAPEVVYTQLFYIIAMKQGYLQDIVNIWVRDIVSHNNSAPFAPNNPNPINFAHNVNVYSSLSWSGGDPDGDDVTYDIYFGKTANLTLVKSGSPNATFNPGQELHMPGGHMQGNTKYFWKIVSTDEHGLSTEGPIWCFKTALAYQHYISTV